MDKLLIYTGIKVNPRSCWHLDQYYDVATLQTKTPREYPYEIKTGTVWPPN